MKVRPRLLFVGAIPPPERQDVIGGVVIACRQLLGSSFVDRVEVLPLDSTQRSVPPPALPVRAFFAVARMVSFLSLVVTKRPDAVLLFSSSGMSFAEKGVYALIARGLGIPPLMFLRDGGFPRHCELSRGFRAFARAVLWRCEFVLCQGARWQRFFTAEFDLPGERCPIVENWTASSEYLAIADQRTGPGGDVRSILFLGWLEQSKGVFELIAAAARLRADPSLPEFRLVLAGNGSAAPQVRTAVNDAGLGDRVVFAGWVAGEEKRRLLAGADIFALPSHAEGLPNAMIEAMASGVPVVVTPVGSVPDVVEHGQNGLLVPVGDHVALSQALAELLRDDTRRAALGAAAHETARTRFAVERAADQLVALVHRAAESSRNAGERRAAVP